MFLQSDWPTIAAVNLPSGGAAYPLSTPGVRLKVEPVKNVSLLLAVLNGDPAGPGPGDEQLRNRYGLNFRVSDPPFVIGEAQFQRNIGKKDEGLATTLKLGGWGHFGQFDDQRFAVGGTLLADPAGSGVPIKHRGNNGLYAVIDQQLYRPKGGDSQSGISVFSRMSISPSDRNLIDRLYRRRHRVRRPDPEAARRQVRRERHLRQVLRQRPRLRSRHGAVHRRARPDPRLRDQPRVDLYGADRPGLDGAAEPAIHLASERRREPGTPPWSARVRSGDIEFVRPRPASSRPASAAPAAGSAPCSPSCASRRPSSRDRRKPGPCAARARYGRGS